MPKRQKHNNSPQSTPGSRKKKWRPKTQSRSSHFVTNTPVHDIPPTPLTAAPLGPPPLPDQPQIPTPEEMLHAILYKAYTFFTSPNTSGTVPSTVTAIGPPSGTEESHIPVISVARATTPLFQDVINEGSNDDSQTEKHTNSETESNNENGKDSDDDLGTDSDNHGDDSDVVEIVNTPPKVTVKDFLARFKNHRDQRQSSRDDKKQKDGEGKRIVANTKHAQDSARTLAQKNQASGKFDPLMCGPLFHGWDKAFFSATMPNALMKSLLLVVGYASFQELYIANRQTVTCTNKKRTKFSSTYLYQFHWNNDFKNYDYQTGEKTQDTIMPLYEHHTNNLKQFEFSVISGLAVNWRHSSAALHNLNAFEELQNWVMKTIVECMSLEGEWQDHLQHYHCTFALQQVIQAHHEDLHLNNSALLKMSNNQHSQKELLGFDFIMPLDLEGTVVRIQKAENSMEPLYIPFGCGLLLRGDCFRAGNYGTPNSYRLVVSFFHKHTNPAGHRIAYAKEIRRDNDFREYASPQETMLLAKRPSQINRDLSGPQLLDKNRSEFMSMVSETTSLEQVVEKFFNSNANMKSLVHTEAKLEGSYPKFFTRFPAWFPHKATTPIKSEE